MQIEERKKAEKTICMWTQLAKEEVREEQQQDISEIIIVLLGRLFLFCMNEDMQHNVTRRGTIKMYFNQIFS